jgi:formyltetrahydrofolate synthetase
MLLDRFLTIKDNHQIFDYKNHVEIAAIAAAHLGFGISPSTITGTWKAMVLNGEEVWEAPIRKIKSSLVDEIVNMKKKFAEQDRKFKTIFEKLDALASSAQGVQENFNFNNGGGDGTELAI